MTIQFRDVPWSKESKLALVVFILAMVLLPLCLLLAVLAR